MATYTNLKQILQNFENIVVKGNHYTKVQSDEKFQSRSAALSAVDSLIKKNEGGAIVINKVDSSADTYSLSVKELIDKSYVDTQVSSAKSYADDKFQIKGNYQKQSAELDAIKNLIAKNQSGAIVIQGGDSSASGYQLAVQELISQSYVDNQVASAKVHADGKASEVKSYADGRFQVKGNYQEKSENLTELASLLARGQNGVIAMIAADGSADPVLSLRNDLATESYVATKVSELVGSAPATLDTLKELAAALNNDANFASTVATELGKKAPLASPTFTGTVTLPQTTKISGLSGTGNVRFDGSKLSVDKTEYQPKSDILSKVISAAGGYTSGFFFVEYSGDSSAANNIKIKPLSDIISITDAELEAMVD